MDYSLVPNKGNNALNVLKLFPKQLVSYAHKSGPFLASIRAIFDVDIMTDMGVKTGPNNNMKYSINQIQFYYLYWSGYAHLESGGPRHSGRRSRIAG